MSDDLKEHLSMLRKQRHELIQVARANESGTAKNPGTKTTIDLGEHSKTHHILEYGGLKYAVMLNQTNLERNNNKYYSLQVLKHNQKPLFLTKFHWGRVGAKGQFAIFEFDNPQQAIVEFKKKFRSKTMNDWGTEKFIPQKRKYIPLDITIQNEEHEDEDEDNRMDEDEKDSDQWGEEEEAEEETKVNQKSLNLEEDIVQVLELIFDQQLAIDTMKELKIDIHKLPLGNLSKAQIRKGYTILCKINDVLVNRPADCQSKLLALSNSFYTNIPHDFGRHRPPLINSIFQLHTKIKLLDSLHDLEVLNRIMKKTKRDTPMLSIESHYKALHCEMELVYPDEMCHSSIINSIQGTHAPTHHFSLQVLTILRLARKGDTLRHLPFAQLGNKRLLWHGSRLSNIVGILSQGLRIAPPEAPSTGYMFGKGIYFADLASKSANYVHATPDHPYGLLLLSEVALGNMYGILEAKYLEQPPKGYHSVWGKGKSIPSQGNTAQIDQHTLDLGPCVTTNDADVFKNSSLNYNEFVVYDVSQVRIRYLVLVKFHFES